MMYKPFRTPLHFYFYDANTNDIVQINESEYRSFERIESKNMTQDDILVLNRYQQLGFCKDSYVKEIRHPNTDTITDFFTNKIAYLYLQITQHCNLRCDYCPYSGKYNNRKHSNKTMSLDVAFRAVDFLLYNCQDTQQPCIGFYGGEPLLEFEMISRIIQYIEEKHPDKDVTYTITTNGTLLSKSIIDFLVKYNFNLTVSLDGPREIQNINRRFVGGQGSFNKIIENLKMIRDVYPRYYAKMSFNSVTAPQYDYKEIVDFFDNDVLVKNNNVMNSLISDIYIDELPKYSDKYYEIESFEKFKAILWALGKLPTDAVSKIHRRWKSKAMDRYRTIKTIGKLTEQAHPSGPCLPGRDRLFMDSEGVFYPCEKISENTKLLKIGSIDNGIDFDRINNIINIGKITSEECKSCWCFGGCLQCAANADDLSDSFSSTKRLSCCNNIKYSFMEDLLNISFLKENNFNFHEAIVEV